MTKAFHGVLHELASVGIVSKSEYKSMFLFPLNIDSLIINPNIRFELCNPGVIGAQFCILYFNSTYCMAQAH